jgi:hypothetical protein
VAQIEALYAELGADQRAHTLLETYKEEAIRCLRDLENPNLKGLLRRVLGKIFNEVEIKGWCKEEQANRLAGADNVLDTVPAPEANVSGETLSHAAQS